MYPRVSHGDVRWTFYSAISVMEYSGYSGTAHRKACAINRIFIVINIIISLYTAKENNVSWFRRLDYSKLEPQEM
jgi:hypothetical protein